MVVLKEKLCHGKMLFFASLAEKRKHGVLILTSQRGYLKVRSVQNCNVYKESSHINVVLISLGFN